MKDSLEAKGYRKYVNLKDVEKDLPAIEIIVQKLSNLHQTLHLMGDVEVQVDEESFDKFRYVTKFNKAFHRLSYEFYHHMDKLEEKGCIIRNIETGLVDFLYKFEGRDIFLCWKLGEKGINHWHELKSGFPGRKKIVNLDKLR